jgi:glutamyl-tRNA synthetase
MTAPVRVRFAPSPTGALHIGSARVALFNCLFARRHGGAFILRIEDTDAARSQAVHEAEIFAALRWLGLGWDEGPDVGGPYGPYRQSERRDRYRAALDQMLAGGHAYPCFCSEARLEELHQRQAAAKQPPRYDGKCRDLPDDERRTRLAAGEPHVVRFRTPRHGELAVDDLIRGRVPVALKNLDDFILVRTSGDPGFILAGAVDDAAMGVTHALRGEDHLTNTHRQLLIFQALGATPPRFGHLPLIVDDDGKKLSKRLGDLTIMELREQGYRPEVIVAHLARLGWAAPPEATTLADMAAAFEVERVARRPARIALADLRHRQASWLRGLDPAALAAAARPFLAGAEIANLEAKAALLVEEAHTPRELAEKIAALEMRPTWDDSTAAILREPSAQAVIAAFAAELARLPAFAAASIAPAIAAAGAAAGVKGKQLYQPLRLALEGKLHGPDLAALAAALGREETSARLAIAAAPN